MSSKRVLALVLCSIFAFSLLFAGCGQTAQVGPSDTGKISSAATSSAASNETGTSNLGDGSGKTLEILAQQGGSGEYMKPVIDKIKTIYPKLEIKIDYNPKVHDVVRPRLVSGNPPDIFMAHQDLFDHYGAIKAGQLEPIDDVLNSKVPGSDSLLKDIFQDGVMNLGFVDGKHYFFPDQQYIYCFYYSKKLFDEKGWTAPTTWDEFIAYCEKVKSSDPNIAPFGYAGANAPFYLADGFVLESFAQLGGDQAIKDMNNLKPGFWQSKPVIDTMSRLKLLVDKGYMYKGTLGINHTESQMMFIDNKIAMLPVGTWLENEMKGNWPDGFNLTPIVQPLGDGSAKYMLAYNSFITIAKDAKEKAFAKEFMRYYYMDDVMKQCAKDYQTVLPVKNNVQYAKDALTPSATKVFELVSNGDVKLVSKPWEFWYKEMCKTFFDDITAVIGGQMTPEDFGKNMEAAAEKVRNDSNIPKYTLQ